MAVWLSAQTGAGLELLDQAIAELLGKEMVTGELLLLPTQGRLRALLYSQQAVVHEGYCDDGKTALQLRLPKSDLLRILSSCSIEYDTLLWSDAEGNGKMLLNAAPY